MLTFQQYVAASDLTLAEIARRIAARLNRPVSTQNVYRWSRPFDHAHFSVPRPGVVVAIEEVTKGQVPPASWYRPRGRARRRAAA